jgi:hypothetical protein
MNCVVCEIALTGKQRRFCSRRCKSTRQSNSDYSNQKRRGQERKLGLIAAKGGRCHRCGYNRCLRALTFHHRDPALKCFPLDARSCAGRPLWELQQEVAKCDLLCANCHAEVEDEILISIAADLSKAPSPMLESPVTT